MFVIEKPLPAITEDGAPYWEYAKQHELRVRRCGACGHRRFPPSTVCPKCRSRDVERVISSFYPRTPRKS